MIYAYISQFDADAAVRIVNALVDAGNSLDHFPRRGRPTRGDRRELPSVPPYVIRYRVDGAVATVISISHGRRRPEPA